MEPRENSYVAFGGNTIIARGALAEVAACCRAQLEAGGEERLAIFDDETGHIVDVDYSGSVEEMAARLASGSLMPRAAGEPLAPDRRGPGRPKLGVVCREVSLLPRHWSWLSEQRGGASATLRRLVEETRKNESQEAIARRAIDAAHRFLWDIAGNQPGFEEATRCLFALDLDRVEELTAAWPDGIRDQLARYTERARRERSV